MVMTIVRKNVVLVNNLLCLLPSAKGPSESLRFIIGGIHRTTVIKHGECELPIKPTYWGKLARKVRQLSKPKVEKVETPQSGYDMCGEGKGKV